MRSVSVSIVQKCSSTNDADRENEYCSVRSFTLLLYVPLLLRIVLSFVHVCDIEQNRAGRLVMEVETSVDEVRWSGAVPNPLV